MSVLRWLTVLAALIVATMALMGCERKITRVEVVQGTENC